MASKSRYIPPYKQGVFMRDVELPKICEQLQKSGIPIEETAKNAKYQKCMTKAYKLMYKYHPNPSSVPVSSWYELYIFDRMEKHAGQARSATKPEDIRQYFDKTVHDYSKLRDEQIKARGKVNANLLPPFFCARQEVGVQEQPDTTDAFTPSQSDQGTSMCDIKESIDCSSGPNHTEKHLGYTPFTLPNEVETLENAFTEPPVDVYPPAEFFRDLLRDKGFGLYMARLTARQPHLACPGLWKAKMDKRCRELMQDALNCAARCQNWQYSVIVSRSNLYQGFEYLQELHRAICRKMTQRVAPRNVPKPKIAHEPPPLPSIFIEEEETTIEDEFDILDTHFVEYFDESENLGEEPPPKVARLDPDQPRGRIRIGIKMTRVVFSEIEKVLYEMTKTAPDALERKPKFALRAKNEIRYEMSTAEPLHIFFQQAFSSPELKETPLLRAETETQTFNPTVSKNYPCIIRHDNITLKVDLCFS